MKCEGCGYGFENEREIFGGVGQAFCFDCWQEEVEIQPKRHALEREYGDLFQQMTEVEREMDAIEEPRYFQEEYGAQQKATVAFDLSTRRAALYFRLSDLQEELQALTLAYHREPTLIGRTL